MPSIAELLLAKAQQQGETWRGLGREIASIPMTVAQAQATDRQAQLDKIALQNAQQHQQGQQVLDTALTPVQPQGPTELGQPAMQPSHPYLDENGMYDVQKLSGVLNANGLGHLAPDLLKSAENINDSIAKHQKAVQQEADTRTVLYGDLADSTQKLIKAGVPPEQAMDLAAQPALASGRFQPQDYQKLKSQLLALPPDQLTAALSSQMAQAERIAPSETLTEGAERVGRYGTTIARNAPKSTTEKASFGVRQADGSVQNVEGFFDKSANNGQGAYYIGTGANRQEVSDRVVKPETAPELLPEQRMVGGKRTDVVFHKTGPFAGQYTLPGGNTVIKTEPMPTTASVNIDAGKLTDVALDQAAQRFLSTGELPPGFGTAGVVQKTAIMNRAAQLDPKAALARNQAIFKADSANLTNLQKTEGTLSAFENTAGKNLDQFLALAAKIPDTGVPWLNQPVRVVNAKLLGSEDQAAFNAARDVALREIARVTNDPKLSGALTDSARNEVSSLSPANATFAQIKRVAQVLKQDMANVHSGLREQIQQVQQGIGANPSAPPSSVSPAQDRVRVKGPNGETGTVPKGTTLPPGWSLQ